MDVFMPDLSRFWFGSETSAQRADVPRGEEQPTAETKVHAQSDYAQLCERVSAARFVA